MTELPDNPSSEVLSQAQLIRLPLQPDVVVSLQRRAAERGRPLGPLALAHELGDVRFASVFAPKAQARPRWQGAFSVFSLVSGSRPALLGYSTHELSSLRDICCPDSWPGDPVIWDEAEAVPLLARLERRSGAHVPFSAEFWPCQRIVDPSKPARGKRRTPGMRKIDIARHMQGKQHDLERPAAYATWLATQLPGATLEPHDVRLTAERTVSAAVGSYTAVAIQLTGLLRIDAPLAFAASVLRGVGRRRAYGLGLVVTG